MKFILIILFASYSIHLSAQSPTANFSANNTACTEQQIVFNNQSLNAANFEWDLCQGDLGLVPNTTNFLNLASFGGNVIVGTDFVFQNGKWFGFYCSILNSSIFRLDFGDNLTNPNPIVTNLGNISNILNGPQAIKIVKEGDSFFGFVSNRNTFKLIRIEFGNDLSAPPASFHATGIISGNAVGNGGIDVVNDNGNWVLAITNQFNVSLVNFGNTLSNLPQTSDILETANFFGASTIGDISILKYNNNWYAFSVSVDNGRLYMLSFGNSLFSSPLIERLTLPVLSNFTPAGVWAVKENNEYRLFVGTNQGNLLRIDLGSNLESIVISENDLGNFGILSSNLKIRGVRDKSRFFLFTTNWQSNALYRLIFPQNCTSNIEFSSEAAPKNVKFSSAGDAVVSLYASGGGVTDEFSQKIVVSSSAAPQILINSNLICLSSPIEFSFETSNLINDIQWSFGDTDQSMLASPTHQYSSAGEYAVGLEVEASNGCRNFAEKTIKIYNPPSASFTLPTGLICTNNEFTFANNTVDNFDGNLSFQWLLDDVPVSTDEDLLLTFNSGGDKEITLQASIPGCSSESVQIVTGVGEGPTVDFTLAGNCLNESTLLTNNSQGAIAGYSWDFGDGQTSTDLNPTVNYTAAGNYTVELETLGSNGCISKKSLPHQIFSVPQPNFNIDLPPFSCNGTPTQFNDLTPTLIDSNLDTWQWNFADQNASASIQHPQYTYALSGDYNVSLTVTSDQGCVATTNKTITIAQSPLPVIVNTPACVETAVVLQDGAVTSASAWQWQVGNNFYFTESPSHVFATAGDYEISLTLTASNGCVRTTTKQVAVPLPLTVNFESAFNCANTATQFTAVVNDIADPVANHTWLFGDDMRSGATVNYLYNAPGTEEVQLIATTQNGCAYTITKAITILRAPVADFSFTPGSGAPPLAVTFTNQSVNANSFLWKFNDAANTTSSLQSPAFTFTDFGEYAVDLTAKNSAGCESTVSKIIAVALPRINVTLDNFRIIPNTDGSFLLLTNILNNGNVLVQNPKIEIQLDNAATLQEVLNTNIVAGASIDYTLSTLVGANNNLNYACIRLVLPNNEAQENTEACITFEANTAITSPYPNPANELVTVEWISPTEESVSVMVNDYLGNVMATETISSQQGLNTLKLQTLDWQAGIYFIRIKSNSREHFFRTIIAR